MTDEERRSRCHFYDQITNPLGCSNKVDCPWGKSHINASGKKECRINGVIGEGHRLGNHGRPNRDV